MTLRDVFYARAIGKYEKIILLILAFAGLGLQYAYFGLLGAASSRWNTYVSFSDILNLYVWLVVFSWVYARVIFSFRSSWRFLAVVPFLYYFIPLVFLVLEPLKKS